MCIHYTKMMIYKLLSNNYVDKKRNDGSGEMKERVENEMKLIIRKV